MSLIRLGPRACLKEPLPSVTRSSQSFLPSGPCTGREKKSSSHCVDGATGTVLGVAGTTPCAVAVSASVLVRAEMGRRMQLVSTLKPPATATSRAPLPLLGVSLIGLL